MINGLSEQEIVRRLTRGRVTAPLYLSDENFRKAAVLIPLIVIQNEWHILFTRRTETVQDHKGQVSFPGGAVEPYDSSPEQAALRETYEEIGIAPQHIRILGRLPDYPTISSYMISPITGRVPWPYELRLSPDEVSRAFTMPLEWLADSRNRKEKLFTRSDGREEMVYFFEPYDGETLWGVTARITVQFLNILGLA